jgi:hypothetical protein
VLWTPGYWGWANGAYAFNEGYWGPHIGFYGGVNYGFGYGGVGFEGGEWRNGGFFYNRAVVNIGGGVRVTNVYEKTVIVNNNTRVSFNGGAGGTSARPSPTELAAARETHVPRTPEQEQHIHAASTNHAMLASVNHGAPTVAATAKPGVFSGKGVVSAGHAAPASAHAPAAREQTTHAPAAREQTTHAPAASHDAVAHPATPQVKHAAPRPKAAPEAKPEGSPAAAHPKAAPEAKPEAARPPAPAAAPHPAAAPRAPEKPEEKRE